MYFCRGGKVPVMLLTYTLVSHIENKLTCLLFSNRERIPQVTPCNGEASIIYGHELKEGITI
jgi:hypothetical protein